ncbi:MAG: FAD-binding oxidoreductase [candidate division KSB1 bacterium]|nr:FAD-binding oxidoreductase [candidate division KSB1 bacterium]
MIDVLKTILASDAIEASGEVLTAYAVCGQRPKLVLFPSTMTQISQLMVLAKCKGKKIMVLGRNSQSSLGSAVEAPDWCISLQRMNQMVEHEPADLMATFQAGVTLLQLQEWLRPHQQFLPLDPPQATVSTLGGIIATNAAGPWQLYFGTVRDLVLGMKIVLPDGIIIRAGGKTVKNVAGYDLSKLFIGSMGTLGIIGEITVRLFPVPAASQTIAAQFERFDRIPPLIRSITNSNLVITRCEYFNPAIADKLGFLNAYSDQGHVVLLSIQGHPEMVTATGETIKNLMTSAGGRGLAIYAAQEEPELWQRINSTSMSDSWIQVQISVPRSKWGAIVLAVENLGREIALPLAIQAHAGSGLIQVGWRTDSADGPSDDGHQVAYVDRLRQLAKQEQGHLVVLRAPLALRNPATIWGEPPENFPWLQKIKSQYDANHQFVAGRFVGGL